MAVGLAPCSCSLLRSFEGLRLRSGTPLQAKAHVQTLKRGQLQVRAARVGNVELPNQKRIEYSLQYIYGIGHPTAIQILSDTGIDNKRTRELSEEELTQLREEVDKYSIEGDLRRFNNLNIKRLQDIGCRRGRRHTARLPVRGQNTKNNARTRKGKAVAIQGKKKATK